MLFAGRNHLLLCCHIVFRQKEEKGENMQKIKNTHKRQHDIIYESSLNDWQSGRGSKFCLVCVTSLMIALYMNSRMSHFLVCFNSSTNFLIYYLNGEKFRRAWFETYGGWCCCCHTQTRAQRTVIEIPRAVPEIHFEMGCKAVSGRLGSSEHVDTVEAEAIKFHTCGPSARDRINRHSSYQNSYENTNCETSQKRGNVTNV